MISSGTIHFAEPPAGSIDRNGLEVLARDACFALLRTAHVGRVGLSIQDLPVVLPVSFALLGDDIVFRTGTGAKLAAALDRTIVAFETDDFDISRSTGWSVCVTGLASLVLHPGDLAAVAGLELVQLVPGPRGHVLRIRSQIVTGRRLPE